MSSFEVDLDSSTILVDGSWLSSDELSARITQALAAKNFGGVGRLGEALESLARELADARSLAIRLSAADFARLAAAGQRMGQSPETFARELLVQVLSGGQPLVDTAPTVIAAPAPAPLDLPPPMIAAEVSPEEAAAALEMKPKKKSASAPPPVVNAPPPPVLGAPPSVVVDAAADEAPKKPAPWLRQR